MMEQKGSPSYNELILTFLKLGFTAFGGPAMQVQIRKEIVDRKQWMEGIRFDAGLALCQVIPGAIIMQLAAYIGLKLKGKKGSVITFIAFGLPSFLIMIGLSMLYKNFRHIETIEAVLVTLRIIVVAIIAHATYTFGKKNFRSINDVAIGFIAALLFLLKLHPAIVINIAVILGLILSRRDKPRFPYTGRARTFNFFLILLSLVLSSLVLLFLFNPTYFTLATIMLRIDLFSFGGGLAAVPMMYHEFVDLFAWLDKKTLFDGIILGQVTPGSIIITATFAGYYHLGLLGSIVATIFVFIPSYLILMALAPFFDRLSKLKNFARGINGILCSFVGLLLITTINFGLDITWSPEAIIIVLISFVLLLLRVNVGWLILGGLALSFLNI
jgi:chromate transporter